MKPALFGVRSSRSGPKIAKFPVFTLFNRNLTAESSSYQTASSSARSSANRILVKKPSRAVTEVRDYLFATTLRSVGGQTDLDDLLSQRDKLNAKIQQIIDAHNRFDIRNALV